MRITNNMKSLRIHLNNCPFITTPTSLLNKYSCPRKLKRIFECGFKLIQMQIGTEHKQKKIYWSRTNVLGTQYCINTEM